MAKSKRGGLSPQIIRGKLTRPVSSIQPGPSPKETGRVPSAHHIEAMAQPLKKKG